MKRRAAVAAPAPAAAVGASEEGVIQYSVVVRVCRHRHHQF